MSARPIVAMLLGATVSGDVDASPIGEAVRHFCRAEALMAERVALVAAERAAEDAGDDAGDDAALATAMTALDAWEARTESERVSLWGRSGFPSA